MRHFCYSASRELVPVRGLVLLEEAAEGVLEFSESSSMLHRVSAAARYVWRGSSLGRHRDLIGRCVSNCKTSEMELGESDLEEGDQTATLPVQT